LDFTTVKRCLLLILSAWLLLACEADATPIALVNEPTSEAATAIPTNPPDLRYGIFVNAEGFVSDLAEIQSRASVEIFYDAGRYTDYDIVAAYGVFEGWQLSPVQQQLILTINPNLAPMNDANIRALILQSIDSAALTERLAINGMQANNVTALSPSSIRTSLANMGYPDGLELSLASSPVPGLELLLNQFAASNIRIQFVNAGNPAHLSLAMLTAAETLENTLELYSLPISYFAREGISVEFSENGWPLPRR
jgi:hypothetical protein